MPREDMPVGGDYRENWQRKSWQNRPYRTGVGGHPQRTGEGAPPETDANGAFMRGVDGGQDLMDSPTPYQPTPAEEATTGAPAALVVMAEAPVSRYTPEGGPIGKDQVRKAYEVLRKYKEGKQHLEDKITRNEKWWRMRHWDLMETEETRTDPKPASGWLFNVIISKHADFMDAFPMSNVLPREQGDVEEAQRLSSIIPVVMDQNGYRDVYSNEVYYKLKHGTGVFGVFWDAGKLNGLGDISIRDMDILGLFWEPGVTDIQKSEHFFSVELVDNNLLEQQYPEQIAGKLSKAQDTLLKKYMYDESIDTTGKSAVIDWYYHKTVNGKKTVQYVKFVDDIVLYATENDTQPPTQTQPVIGPDGQPAIGPDGAPMTQQVPTGPSMAERGLYDHGMYPFVFDPLFPEAGMPVGFGFVDVCKHAQASIDIYNNCFEKNLQYGAVPRWAVKNDGGINEEEFADPSAMLVHVDGNLGQDSFAPIGAANIVPGNYMSLLQAKIDEMKETAGNRDATNGGTAHGVTAASAIAAMQEASGKTSRDQINTTYEAHKRVVTMVIELIRQFYDMPRQFRIIGQQGQEEFTQYSNAGLQPQYQGVEYGVDMGFRLPVFDVKVEAEKTSSYSRLSQNELALQFYNNGFFNPQYADQALACIDMMDFEGKSTMVQKVQQNGGMYQQLLQLQQRMLSMAEMIDQLTGGQYNMAGQMAGEVNAQLDANAANPAGNAQLPAEMKEAKTTKDARQRTAESTQPK